jgi:hypothetical protein
MKRNEKSDDVAPGAATPETSTVDTQVTTVAAPPHVRFADKVTDEVFECLAPRDVMVHKAGVYSGLLSKIPVTMGHAMVLQKSNLIKEK